MPWQQLIFSCDENQAEPLSDLLSELGAVSVTFTDGADQPLYEPNPGETPLWHSTRLWALFDAQDNIAAIIKELDKTFAPNPIPSWRSEILEDQDWTRAWMDHFKPMRFGQRLWIIPSGYSPADANAVNIHLDPGLAFGTGTHPTTRLCLEWLEAHPPLAQSVCDYGCGSGILAIAAALLGARQIWGVDNDPQALIASQDNAKRNQISQEFALYSPQNQPQQQADLVLANILAGPLQELAPHLASLTRTGGHIVLSGILAQQAESVSQAYAPFFVMEQPQVLEDWVRLSGKRK